MFQKEIIKTVAIVIYTVTAFSGVEASAFGPGSAAYDDYIAGNYGLPADKPAEYEISIENLTATQPLTPPVIVYGGEKLFEVGVESSRALSLLAEDGITTDYKSDKGFRNITVGTKGIMPGSTQVFTLKTKKELDPLDGGSLSVISMLARTNDAFIGLDNASVTSGFGAPLSISASNTFFAKVYDAGSEYNSESCEDIPAPPCNSHNARSTKAAEGIVSLHPGLKLINSDLTNADLFPIFAAKITITRIK